MKYLGTSDLRIYTSFRKKKANRGKENPRTMRFDFKQFFSGPKRILMHTLIASFALFSVCLVVLLCVQSFGGSAGGPSQNPDENGQNGGNETKYTSIPVASSDVYAKGSLLVVNVETKIQVYPSDSELANLYEERPENSHYKLNLTSFRLRREAFDAFNAMILAYYDATGDESITVTSAYRSEAEQAALTSSSVQAGYSDHHLGLSLALKSNSNGIVSSLSDNHWIYENGYKYGYIQRYPEGKEDSTLDTQNYTNCVRYVGIPHATYMHENDLSLEEYVALVKNYTYDGTHLTVTADGASYEIYYVAASNLTDPSGVTQLPVPEGAEYSYSGNNTDGFIVTVKAS